MEKGHTGVKRLMKTLQTSFDELDDTNAPNNIQVNTLDTEGQQEEKINFRLDTDFYRSLNTNSPFLEKKQEVLKEINIKMKVFRKNSPHCDKNKILSILAKKIKSHPNMYYDYIKETNAFLLRMLIHTLYDELEALLIEQDGKQSNGPRGSRKDPEYWEELVREKDQKILRLIAEKQPIIDILRVVTLFCEDQKKLISDCCKRLKPEPTSEYRSSGTVRK